MKIKLSKSNTRPFQKGDILREKKTGTLYILSGNGVDRNRWGSVLIEQSTGTIRPSSNQNAIFGENDYELFEGTITLSNEA